MKRLLVALALLSGIAHATTYYVANAGSDSNSGTSVMLPWQNIAKLNTVMASLQPGDSALLHRGDTFRDDYIRCLNEVTATTSTTYATNPPVCWGSAAAPITIGSYGSGPQPIIDGADVLSLTWTLVQGTTWQATFTGATPTKLYVDSVNFERQQLVPQPNYVGAYASGTTYQFLDAVTNGSGYYLHGGEAATTNVNAVDKSYVWLATQNPNSGTASQVIPTNGTGLQNVEAGLPALTATQINFGYPTFPGAWYVTGSTIYVNLADGSNPNNHVFSGSRRLYGILMSGVSYVTVQDISIEHTQKSAVLAVAFTATTGFGSYFGNEYNVFQRLNVWNYGDTVFDSYPAQGGVRRYPVMGGIIVQADASNFPHILRGIQILNNRVGMMDSFFGLYSSETLFQYGISASGIDGGGPANNIVIAGNYISTKNAKGAAYSNVGVNWTSSSSQPTFNNSGGRVTNNEFVNNQGNLYFTSVDGGLADHNYVHESFGEGFQLGGQSTSVNGGTSPVSGSQVISFNRILHIWKSASGADYNGFDCNTAQTAADSLYVLNNTIVDTWGASLSLEGSKVTAGIGCTAMHVRNNIFDQNMNAFPLYTTPNGFNIFYYVGLQYSSAAEDFSNNFYALGGEPDSHRQREHLEFYLFNVLFGLA